MMKARSLNFTSVPRSVPRSVLRSAFRLSQVPIFHIGVKECQIITHITVTSFSLHLVLFCAHYALVSAPDPNQPQRGSLPVILEVIHAGVGFVLGPRLIMHMYSIHTHTSTETNITVP